MDILVKLTELKEKEGRYQQKLVGARLRMGEADTPMQSQFPTGRFELEQDITVLELTLAEIRAEITGLEKQLKTKKAIS
jgi:hypothetical protein